MVSTDAVPTRTVGHTRINISTFGIARGVLVGGGAIYKLRESMVGPQQGGACRKTLVNYYDILVYNIS